jgi:hypothetical protein
MIHIVGDQDQIGGLGPRQIADAPWIDVNDLAAVFELDVRVCEGRDVNISIAIDRSRTDAQPEERRSHGCYLPMA